MTIEEQLDYELMKQKALEQLRSGKSLYGKDGAFAPLLRSFLDSALEAEIETHMDENERFSVTEKMVRPRRTSKLPLVQFPFRPHEIETLPSSPKLSVKEKPF
jgi:hypothetical protein